MLTEEYLRERHSEWIGWIADAGIWEAKKFKSVNILVRPRSKNYHGLFRRKYIRRGLFRRYEDCIILYRNTVEETQLEIDSTLVHEMIHQYIFQNNIRDTSAHGKVFREFMHRINNAFPDSLHITISSKRQHVKGPGRTIHKLILLIFENGECYCCHIQPSRVEAFMRLIAHNKKSWQLKSYQLCESNDSYFDSVRSCRTRLHGIRIAEEQLTEFCKEYRLKCL